MKKLSIGIIGAGRIGNVHAESITYHMPEAEVAMVTDVIEESARKLAERLQTQVRAVFENTDLAEYVSFSVGIALCPAQGRRFAPLFP